MSAVSYVETAIVIESRLGYEGTRDLDFLLHKADIEIVASDRHQGEIARRAYRRFGIGNHRAGLNFGDCFAYALAKSTGLPLLYKGGDFAHTDVSRA